MFTEKIQYPRNQVSKFRWNRLFFLVLFLLFLTEVKAYEYVIQGTITYEVYLGDSSSPLAEQEDDFSFSLKNNCFWNQQVSKKFNKFGKPQLLFGGCVASSDSTNYYWISSNSTQLAKSPLLSGSPPVSALIGTGVVPYRLMDPKAVVLWYAFGSSCYLSNVQDNCIYPTTINNASNERNESGLDFRVSASWKLQKEPPFLPSSIIFDEMPCQSEIRSNNLIILKTNCVYTADKFTTSNGLTIPWAASVSNFNKSGILSGVMKIKVTNVLYNVNITNFQPIISGPVQISDVRTISPNTPRAVFLITTQGWPSLRFSQRIANDVSRTEHAIKQYK
jgi:hypothetical protein